jgi:addiction module HigA family antidote
MTEHHDAIPANRPARRPTHPGEILRKDVLPALNMTVSSVADHLHVSRQMLRRILAGEADISPEMALRLGKFCGNGAELWLGMQNAVSLWDARQALRHELDEIPTMRAKARF